MKDNNKRNNNVLNFRQPVEFFIKKAERHVDAGNLLEALSLYRCVLGMEPQNTDYLLNIAQIYSEMGLYAESNDVLLKIAKYGNTPTECLFALGCNYMGLKNFALADEAFEQYLAIDPDGEFAEDIDELFDIIDEEEYGEDTLHDINRKFIIEKAFEGKQCLDKGDFKTAILILEEVANKDCTLLSAINNLALAYFFDGKKQKAVETAQRVIGHNPHNLHACCNLALFYSELNDHAKASQYLNKLDDLPDIEPEDMHKVALTYCELGYHEKAYSWFLKIMNFQPYDIRILHFCGIAALNSGKYIESSNCFEKILRIEPQNSLAVYYKAYADNAKKNRGHRELEYVYQVQFDEIKRRISYLNECLKKKEEALKQKWKNDSYFSSIILWGLNYGDEYIKKIVLEIISMLSDEKAEETLRDVLLKSTESDEMKNDVFMYLNRMGAKEPYVAYINGAIAEVRVGSMSEDIGNLPPPYAKALSIFVENAKDRYDDAFITAGAQLVMTIAKERNDEGVWIKKSEALAAALELCVSELLEIKRRPLKKELQQIYSVTLTTLNKYYNMLFERNGDGRFD